MCWHWIAREARRFCLHSFFIMPAGASAAFTPPPSGAGEGNLGRNALRGLGAWQADLALHRLFQLSEQTRVEFHCERLLPLTIPTSLNSASSWEFVGKVRAQRWD